MSKLEGPSILPKDPYDRALARFWSKYLDHKEQEKAKEEVCEMLKVLDNELKAKKFFVGDKFGFAANFVGHWLGVFVFGKMSILVVAKSRNIHFHKEELLAFAQARALASASASAKK
ncbi:hypothetical protein P3S68_028431 [Capsicum galapagoense]